MTVTEEALKRMTPSKKPPSKRSDYLSSGSTLLNLAISGTTLGLYLKGRYIYYVGDSMSGKTWLVLTALAEAVRNPSFSEYRLIYDDAEDGALMKLEKFFGAEVVERLEPPSWDEDDEELHSATIEDFYDNITDALTEAEKDGGRPFIYILDSMDSLSSEAQDKKFEENKRKRSEGKAADQKGSFGDGKAKKNSEHLRKVRSRVKATNSILIIISQTRDDINPRTFTTKTRSGGKALTFYAHVEIWTSTVANEKKEFKVNKKEYKKAVKQTTRCRIKKNRITGNTTDVDLTILKNYGVDDIGDNVDFLVKYGHWEMKKQTIIADDFDFSGVRKRLIAHIEENNLERMLQSLVRELWEELEEVARPKRKKRYG